MPVCAVGSARYLLQRTIERLVEPAPKPGRRVLATLSHVHQDVVLGAQRHIHAGAHYEVLADVEAELLGCTTQDKQGSGASASATMPMGIVALALARKRSIDNNAGTQTADVNQHFISAWC